MTKFFEISLKDRNMAYDFYYNIQIDASKTKALHRAQLSRINDIYKVIDFNFFMYLQDADLFLLQTSRRELIL